MSLVRDPANIRLAMLGMVEGNGHPFSWSAIINGRYDPKAMADCGYPVIPQYLDAEPRENLGIPGVQVSHIWCDNPDDAGKVARAVFIPKIVARPEDVIGQVDAVIIPTDKGEEHLDRARPFIEAGIPVFIDKPLTTREDHLRQFVAWQREGRAICSTSCMRYGREFTELRTRLSEVGRPRFITSTTCKSWARYGIHALEGAYPLLPPGGWRTVADTGTGDAAVVHANHEMGVDVVIAAIDDMVGSFGCLDVYGTDGSLHARFADTFFAFKAQLVAFVDYLRTGKLPFAFEQTVELMKIIIAAARSREEGSRVVNLSEIRA